MNPTPAIQKFKNSFSAHGSDGARPLHFNNAGVSPISKPAREAITFWADRLYQDGYHAVADAFAQSEHARQILARTLGASENEVAFFLSTSSAISQIALGFDFKSGDEIIIFDQEYPSNFHPWRVAAERTGAVVKIIETSGPEYTAPIAAIEKMISPRTRMIAVSWVQYRTGAIVDLEALTQLTRGKNIFTCVDIIQGAGLLPFDFHASGVDAVCGGSHKWFVSPASVGYLILKEEHLSDSSNSAKIKPMSIGAMTYGGPDDVPTLHSRLRPGAVQFEPGSRAFLDLIAFGASLELFSEVGISNIAQETEWLSRRLMHGLRERGYMVHSPHGSRHRGAIVNFTPTPDARFKNIAEITAQLGQNRVSFAQRLPGVRLSPHAFNTVADIDKVLSILE